MLAWSVFCALLCVTSALVLRSGSRNNPNLRVHPRKYRSKTQNDALHYHHPTEDYTMVTTAAWVGQPPALVNILVDTTTGDIEMKMCPEKVQDSDRPCYDASKSQTYYKLNDNQALEVFKGINLDDKYMVNLTYLTHCEIEGRVGFGWPSLRKYPDDSFYPFTLFDQKPCNHAFQISLALDGCVGEMDWGTTCATDNYPTNFVPLTSNKYWQFQLNGFTFGPVDEKFSSQAVIATSHAYIGMPKQHLTKMMAAYNITWDNEYGAYTTWCFGRLPDFKLKLQGLTLTIKSAQYMYTWLPLVSGKCVVNFEDSAANGFGAEWYFGLPLMTSYCVGFDYDNTQIGFMYNDWSAGDDSCHSN